jgi:hypothetical protein
LSGAVVAMNPFTQGIQTLPPGTLPLHNVAPGQYRLDVLDNTNRITKSMDVQVIDGQQADYDV